MKLAVVPRFDFWIYSGFVGVKFCFADISAPNKQSLKLKTTKLTLFYLPNNKL